MFQRRAKYYERSFSRIFVDLFGFDWEGEVVTTIDFTNARFEINIEITHTQPISESKNETIC